MAERRPIGLFDSGVGGLTVARAISDMLPGESMIYLGDTARTPYGPRDLKEVRGFVVQIVDFLVSENVKAVVIACNTATAAGLDAVKDRWPIPIIGVVMPGAKSAVQATRNRRVGVIATEATIRSGAYVRAIGLLDGEVRVFEQACPLLVPLVEQGRCGSESARRAAIEYLTPLKETCVDVLILGCTHYPFLSRVIREVMGPEVTLVYPAVEIAMELRDLLEARGLLNGQEPGALHRFYVTGDPSAFLEVGRTLFGSGLPRPHGVRLAST